VSVKVVVEYFPFPFLGFLFILCSFAAPQRAVMTFHEVTEFAVVWDRARFETWIFALQSGATTMSP
jgi:hypothetical protein